MVKETDSDTVRTYQKLKHGRVLNDIYDLDGIAEFLELPTWEQLEELNDYFNWAGDGIEDETEREEAIDNARDDGYSQWKKGLLEISEDLLGFHEMALKPLNGYEFQVVAKSWRKAAECVIGTINAYGMFWYDDPEDLRDVGPYQTFQEAVLEHLHWIKKYPKVYGTRSISQMWDSLWR